MTSGARVQLMNELDEVEYAFCAALLHIIFALPDPSD